MVDLGFANEIAKIASTDLFGRDGKNGELRTGLFVGRPFYLDYDRAHLLVADSWKMRAGCCRPPRRETSRTWARY